MEVQVVHAIMMAMTKAEMVVLAAVAAAVQIIWVPVVEVAILVEVVIKEVDSIRLEEVEVPIMEDQIKLILQEALHVRVVTVR